MIKNSYRTCCVCHKRYLTKTMTNTVISNIAHGLICMLCIAKHRYTHGKHYHDASHLALKKKDRLRQLWGKRV